MTEYKKDPPKFYPGFSMTIEHYLADALHFFKNQSLGNASHAILKAWDLVPDHFTDTSNMVAHTTQLQKIDPELQKEVIIKLSEAIKNLFHIPVISETLDPTYKRIIEAINLLSSKSNICACMCPCICNKEMNINGN